MDYRAVGVICLRRSSEAMLRQSRYDARYGRPRYEAACLKMFSRCLCLLAVFVAVQGRAVNISNTWVLPEEGFPVFYRYFRDRISWYEADAVCQFHHANLVTVDTTAQYDAVRAYLKELDISSAVWLGLIRSNPDGEFTWTDYRGLSGDGYWSSAPDARTAPLCAAADPSADYRWEARACGGPTVASFICELPVPQWALGNEGCMVRNLPALTVLYLPESAAVQLTADCGLAGVKRVQCTGNIKRDLLLKNLTCIDEDVLTTPTVSIQGITWPITTESVVTDQDNTNDSSTEEIMNTSLYEDKTAISNTTHTSVTVSVPVETKSVTKPDDQKLHSVYLNKQVNLNILLNNNEQRNDIPHIGNDVEDLMEEQAAKLEDARNLQHKLLHDELARRGNFDNIFNQPADHFVPPLVMAKAKVSDDMTVLSLAEKHAQQLAEHRNSQNKAPQKEFLPIHKVLTENYHTDSQTNVIETTTEVQIKSIANKHVSEQIKKDNKIKYNSPKKYNEKTAYSKGKYPKTINNKLDSSDINKIAEVETHENINFDKNTSIEVNNEHKNVSPDDTLDLTVILKEPENINQNMKMDVVLIEPENSTHSNIRTVTTTEQIETTKNNEHLTTPQPKKLNLNDEIIKITIVKEDEHKNEYTVGMFDVTTSNPMLDKKIKSSSTTESTTELVVEKHTSASTLVSHTSMKEGIESTAAYTTITSYNKSKMVSKEHSPEVTSTLVFIKSTSETPLLMNGTIVSAIQLSTEFFNSSFDNASVTEMSPMVTEDIPYFNHTEEHEGHGYERAEEPIDDLNSPLLSAASEPLHRPPRLRRPQQTNHAKKFNPFRILG